MPSVPVIQDSVSLQTGTGRQRVRADPDAFGAIEARGGEKLAQGLGAVAEVAAQKEDEFAIAEAQELDNQLSAGIRERLWNPESGYYATQRGRNAIEGRAQIEADIDALAGELAGASRNRRAQNLFVGAARRRVAQELGSIAEYAARETTAYQNEVSEAVVNEAVNNAVAGYADPALVQVQRNTALAELERLRERNGWDETIYADRVRQFQSDVSARIVVQMAQTDPAAALAYYAEIAPSLTAQDAAQLRAVVAAAIRQREETAIDEAYDYVAAGRRVPPEIMTALPGRAEAQLQDYIRLRAERLAEGAMAVRDPARVRDIEGLITRDPAAFAARDLTRDYEAIGHTAFQRLRTVQRDLLAGSEPQGVAARRTEYNALRGIAQASLGRYMNLDPGASARGVEAERAQAFDAALLRELEDYRAAAPNQPLDDAASQMLIARAVLSLDGETVGRAGRAGMGRGDYAMRVEGDRGLTRGRVAATTEVVLPFDAIPQDYRSAIANELARRGVANPTRGEVQNAYAALIESGAQTAEDIDEVLARIVAQR